MGEWKVQALADTTLLTPASEPESYGQALFYGELAVTDGGCFGVKGNDDASTVIFPPDTVLLDNEEIETLGVRFRLGDLVALEGGGFPSSDLPQPCKTPDRILMAYSVRLMTDDEVRTFK